MRDTKYDILYKTEKSHWWYRARRVLVSGLVERHRAELGKTLCILDVGCGTGLLMRELQIFGKVDGVDISKLAVAYCNKRGLVPTISSAEHLPYPDRSFDVVIILDVLEHLLDDGAGAKEIARVLTMSGIGIITVPAFKFLWGITDTDSQHYRRYTRKEIVAVLEGAGLKVQRSTYFNAFLFPPIAAIRFVVRAFNISVKSENAMGCGILNYILYRIFSLEIYLLRYINFPIGVSVLVIVSKK